MELPIQVINNDPNPTYVKNELGQFILANDAYAKLHGLSVNELLAKGTGAFDYSRERDLELLTTGETLSIEELYKVDNGEKMWFKTTKKPLRQADGTLYLLSVSSDITALKNAVQQAEESAKAKEGFLESISNEIRTPVNAVIGIVKLLKKSFLNKDQEDYLDTIASIANNLLVIPNDLLEAAKFESGEVKLVKVPFDLTTILGDTVRAVAFKVKEQGFTVRFVKPNEQIPMVEGDPFRLSQVVVNLIYNAMKYIRQGEIVVSVHQVEIKENVLNIDICVQEKENELSGAKLEKAYDTINTEKNSSTRLYNSSGLGLTISKKLVELQGGRVWIDNKANKASCFYFSIPYTVSPEHPPLNDKEDAGVEPDQLKGLQILVAEDNQLNELLLMSQLKSWGVEADVAYDGEQALAKANDKVYDLILMDIQMPKLDGIEATYRIRNKQSINKDTPVIAFTANLQEIDVERYKYYGFTDYLLKPYQETKLFYTLRRLTDHGTKPQATPPREIKEEAVPPFDFSGLGKLKDDALFIRKMQQMFIDTVPRQLEELEEAIVREKMETAAQIAHKLKSTYGNIKITAATEAMRKIEGYAHKRVEADKILPLLREAQKITSEVVEIFSNQLHANT